MTKEEFYTPLGQKRYGKPMVINPWNNLWNYTHTNYSLIQQPQEWTCYKIENKLTNILSLKRYYDIGQRSLS